MARRPSPSRNAPAPRTDRMDVRVRDALTRLEKVAREGALTERARRRVLDLLGTCATVRTSANPKSQQEEELAADAAWKEAALASLDAPETVPDLLSAVRAKFGPDAVILRRIKPLEEHQRNHFSCSDSLFPNDEFKILVQVGNRYVVTQAHADLRKGSVVWGTGPNRWNRDSERRAAADLWLPSLPVVDDADFHPRLICGNEMWEDGSKYRIVDTPDRDLTLWEEEDEPSRRRVRLKSAFLRDAEINVHEPHLVANLDGCCAILTGWGLRLWEPGVSESVRVEGVFAKGRRRLACVAAGPRGSFLALSDESRRTDGGSLRTSFVVFDPDGRDFRDPLPEELAALPDQLEIGDFYGGQEAWRFAYFERVPNAVEQESIFPDSPLEDVDEDEEPDEDVPESAPDDHGAAVMVVDMGARDGLDAEKFPKRLAELAFGKEKYGNSRLSSFLWKQVTDVVVGPKSTVFRWIGGGWKARDVCARLADKNAYRRPVNARVPEHGETVFPVRMSLRRRDGKRAPLDSVVQELCRACNAAPSWFLGAAANGKEWEIGVPAPVAFLAKTNADRRVWEIKFCAPDATARVK